MNSSPPWRAISVSRGIGRVTTSLCRTDWARRRSFLQQEVADFVAERVVDALEAVEVEREHRQHVVGALGAGHGVAQLLLEEVPVRQARQAVVQGELLDLLLGTLAVGDVLNLEDEVSELLR